MPPLAFPRCAVTLGWGWGLAGTPAASRGGLRAGAGGATVGGVSRARPSAPGARQRGPEVPALWPPLHRGWERPRLGACFCPVHGVRRRRSPSLPGLCLWPDTHEGWRRLTGETLGPAHPCEPVNFRFLPGSWAPAWAETAPATLAFQGRASRADKKQKLAPTLKSAEQRARWVKTCF